MTVTPTFSMSGSILAGTAEHRLISVETDLQVNADTDPDTVRSAVETAERMCFVLDGLQRSHDVVRHTSLNGEPL